MARKRDLLIDYLEQVNLTGWVMCQNRKEANQLRVDIASSHRVNLERYNLVSRKPFSQITWDQQLDWVMTSKEEPIYGIRQGKVKQLEIKMKIMLNNCEKEGNIQRNIIIIFDKHFHQAN